MSNHPRRYKRVPREVDKASGKFKPCSYCGRHYSIYKGAWKIHEKTCQKGPGPGQCKSKLSTVPTSTINQASGSSPQSDSDEEMLDSAPMAEAHWERPNYPSSHVAEPSHYQPAVPGHEDIEISLEDPHAIPPLDETQVWIKRHPASGQPSGFLTPEFTQDQTHRKRSVAQQHSLPPFFPFHTHSDFIQAEIFSDYGSTDKHMNRQLALPTESVTLKNARDYHDTLAIAARLWGKPVVTEFEGSKFTHHVHFQSPFSVLSQIVGDPELFKDMICYPEQQHVHRPGTNNGTMQLWEELWHSDLWWELQDHIGPDRCVLYLVVYIDETNVSKIGGVKVWPIYVWVGNLPAWIRKRRGKKGGGTLIGYLPKARKKSGVKDLAGFRCKVYHDALHVIFESLKIPSRHGAPIRCGDGDIRNFVPIIAAGSADYMEFIRMICILGHRSEYTCLMCLVPHHEQSRLTESWPMRTVSGTEDVLQRANDAETVARRNEILHEQSLRDIRSAFFDLIPASIHSIYDAIIADPLHQIEQGVWGKHLWMWIRNDLPKASKQILDDRIKAIARYPDLKHFPNGITDLEYLTGKEHGVILRLIVPLIDDLILDNHRKLIFRTFRSLAEIYIMAKFTTHNDITLERLDEKILKFDRLHRKLAETFPEVHGNYPKFHSLSHLTSILRRHGTTDNYQTGMGEALHPASKRDYRRSNQQPDFEIQMLRMYQEREAIMRIRAQVDLAVNHDEDDEHDVDDPWSGPRVHFGSSDRKGRQEATEFARMLSQHDPAARNVARFLRTFLYQRVGGFGSLIHFRESDLPLLDGMMVSVFQLVTVGYVSMLDSRNALDVARATHSWRKQGPRHDYVLVDDGRELFIAQLLRLFNLKARDELHSLAYVRLFKISRRSKTTGFIELTDTGQQNFIFANSIIRSCVVLSPGIHATKHILWDLEGPDMYLRLQDL
ncbi:hypothetical protein FRC10_011167 [Ceratobasidium sp. 414]|nr:hypothetical protein FRC10_011167 [Ceratobasidium sp. 414]